MASRMRAHGRHWLSIVLVGLAASASATAADAAWSPPTSLFGPADVPQHQVAVAGNAAGDGLVTWFASDDGQNNPALRVARRFPDGHVGAAQTLSTSFDALAGPSAALASDGTGAVVWPYDGAGVNGAILPADGSAPQPFLLAEPRDNCRPTRPQVAAGGGTLALAWQDCDAIYVSVRPPGGTFGTATRIAAPAAQTGDPIYALQLAVGSDGTIAVLGWAYETIWSAVQRPGASGFTVTRLSSSTDSGALDYDTNAGVPAHPGIGVGADGTVAAAWMDQPSGDFHWLAGAVMAPDGTWRTQRITPFSEMGSAFRVAVDGAGDATIAFAATVPFWAAGTPADLTGALVVTAPAGGAFGPVRELGPQACEMTAAPDSAGGIYVAWTAMSQGCQGSDEAVVAAHQPAGAAEFDDPDVVVASHQVTFPPAIAPLGADGAILGWSQGDDYRDVQVVKMATTTGGGGGTDAPPATDGGAAPVHTAPTADPGVAPTAPSAPAAPASPAAPPVAPGAGVLAASGTKATTPRAAASAPRRCRVPSVVGRTLPTAEARLAKAGCAARITRAHAARATAHPRVIRQSPRAGTVHAARARVTLTLR